MPASLPLHNSLAAFSASKLLCPAALQSLSWITSATHPVQQPPASPLYFLDVSNQILQANEQIYFKAGSESESAQQLL